MHGLSFTFDFFHGFDLCISDEGSQLSILTLHSDYRLRNTLYALCCFTNSVSLSFEAGHTFRHPQTPNLSRSLIWNDFTFVRILEVKPWPTKASTQHFRFQFYLHHENRVMWTVTATASNPSLLYGIQSTEFHWTFDHGHDKNTRSIILIYETTTISYRIFFHILCLLLSTRHENGMNAQLNRATSHIYISVSLPSQYRLNNLKHLLLWTVWFVLWAMILSHLVPQYSNPLCVELHRSWRFTRNVETFFGI